MQVPYPSDLRAKGWKFQLDYERINQSATWKLAAKKGLQPHLLMLWFEAWQQTPVGTLPADDEVVAAMVGMDDGEFEKAKSILMRGWIEADDGRLYHETLTEQVLEMVAQRIKDRKKVAEWRAKQLPVSNNEVTGNKPNVTGYKGDVTGKSLVSSAPEPEPIKNKNQSSPVNNLVTGVEPANSAEMIAGEQSSPENQTVDDEFAAARALVESHAGKGTLPPTRTGSIAVLLRTASVRAQSQHPQVIEWANRPEVTDPVLAEAVAIARQSKGNLRFGVEYLAPIVEQVLKPRKAKGDDLWSTDTKTVAKGQEYGLTARPGEDWHAFRSRIRERIGAENRA